MTLNHFFDRVFVINLPRRTDRRALAEAELKLTGINSKMIEWADGVEIANNGHAGCTRAHRNLLRRVADGPWRRVLVLEDDFAVITKQVLLDAGFTTNSIVYETFCRVLDGKGNLDERFDFLSNYLPNKWDMLYLGAGYGEAPKQRLNRHVIRCGFMQTTSSYGITREWAKEWTHLLDAAVGPDGHPGQIDNTFGGYAHDHLYYVFKPRLTYQRASLSDITGETNSYLFSMTDPFHENLV